ncbi:protein RGF1 INDUCIBLE TRANSCRIPTION FACTOR 1 [Syzygium oleosum]|uniref:protein RGF1 INDUCIBLE TRANSCRIPTION FACTOR 1 n=1 Tax=Syzygium oleosum TaxID=219896 RepID=UPI0011D2B270|nr:protein RGF1 INDUCIBLE TRANSCRIPTION FACTOR 1 [Syzygium oleosum]
MVPPWLESLLSTSFFSNCPSHRGTPRSECNMYCLDCESGAFCYYCRSSRHKDHHVIQIRRSSYHDVVRVAEIDTVLDISGVQTYVINSARVLFLNERPQPRSSTGKGVSHLCEICSRSLLDPLRFCSLGCKLEGIKRNGDASFVLSAKNDEETAERKEGMARRLPCKADEGSREGRQIHSHHQPPPYNDDVSPPTPPPPSTAPSNSRRRKGIPRRAPFGY